MATLIFDIETVGRDWEGFDSTTQAYLTKSANTALTETERTDKINEITSTFGLSPLTGKIVTIGVYDLDRSRGAVYFQSDESLSWQEGEFVFRSCTEAEMLTDFWEGAQSYDVFVTFAGRVFDAPFLNIRSAALGIMPTKELLEHRYLSRQTLAKHVDLQDQLSYYGALGQKPSLHLSAQVFGIESSKAAGVSGADVAELFRQKQFRDIATYNMRDVITTTELYKKWYEYLAPASFRNVEH